MLMCKMYVHIQYILILQMGGYIMRQFKLLSPKSSSNRGNLALCSSNLDSSPASIKESSLLAYVYNKR